MGGVSVRGEQKAGPVNLAANLSNGLRASTRIASGTRVAVRNRRFQLVGWEQPKCGAFTLASYPDKNCYTPLTSKPERSDVR